MTPDRLAVEITRRLDGPHADEHTSGAACVVAETVRFLNYATGHHAAEGLRYPATVYEVAGQLSAAAHRMLQLCDQLTRWLYAEDSAGRLGNDDGTPPGVTVALAADRLRDAALLAGKLGDELAAFQSVISGLHARGGAR